MQPQPAVSTAQIRVEHHVDVAIGLNIHASLDYNVPDAVANPQLTVFSRAEQAIDGNDDWGAQPASTAAEMSATFSQVGAFALPDGSRDSALVVELPPGAYTAHASAGSPGSVLIEIYAVP